VGNEIRAFIEERENELVLLDEVYGLGTLELKEQRTILGNLLLYQRIYQEMVLLNSEGQEQIRLSRTDVFPDDGLESRAGLEEFLFPARRGGTYFGPVRFDETIREPLVTISLPLFDRRSGEIISVLVADLRFKKIWDLLAAIELPNEGGVYVVDQAGQVMAHRNRTIVLRGATIELPEADGRAEGLSGMDAIVATDTLQFGDQELVVVAEQPVSNALELATNSLRIAVAITSAALVFAVLLVVLASRRIARPVLALATAAQAIGRGDYSVQVKVSSRDEVGRLASAFNQMVSDLKESREKIEQYTLELESKNKQLQRDITRRKQAEEELREAQEQLVRREKLAVLGQLAGGVSHELRNPLGAIKNAAYFLNIVMSEGEPEPEVKETLEILEKEVATSERIIGSLLDFARPKPLVRRKVEINDVVREALSRTTVPDAQCVEVVSQLDETLPVVLADPGQLAQVFGNLILNGIQAMPEGGRLAIKSEVESPEWLVVSFTDTGVGIAEEKLGRLFEPLFTTKAKGIGLGLALAKALVEEHGGTIEVQSTVGKGSTFTVRLPVDGELS
jgi:signal transduction histidine kinase